MKKYYKYIYVIILIFVASSVYWGFIESGILPPLEQLSFSGIKAHLTSLRFENLFWALGLPGLIGLILFKQRHVYMSFFFKMFRIILLIMAIPVAIGLWGAFQKSISPLIFFAVYIATLTIISLIGAFMMTQKEYIFGEYKKDTAWRHKRTNKGDKNG